MSPVTLPNGRVLQQVNSLETGGLVYEIFERRIYLDHGVALPPGSVVIDAGANIGVFTLFVLENCPSAQVHTFEPAPQTFALLQANTQGCPNVRNNPCGLGARRALAPFTYFPRASVCSGYDAEAARERVRALLGPLWEQHASGRRGVELMCKSVTQDVEIRPLGEYIDEHGLTCIDLLKIDVEGCECDVLAGIRPEQWDSIRQVVLEVHSDALRRQVESTLEERGYSVRSALQAPPLAMVYARRPWTSHRGSQDRL